MREYLVFTLRGIMQSWGTGSAVGEVRPSANHPGRSAVAGLIAGALGIRHTPSEELALLHAGCRLGVRVCKAGSRMTDYHTVQVPPGTGKRTYRTRRDELVAMLRQNETPTATLSQREYLEDSAFTICLWLEQDIGYSLQEMGEALKFPRFVPYLGRKSCPVSCPMRPEVIQAGHVVEAYREYDRLLGKSHGDCPVWADQGHGIDMPEKQTFMVRDLLTNPEKRQFTIRKEEYLVIPATKEGRHVHE